MIDVLRWGERAVMAILQWAAMSRPRLTWAIVRISPASAIMLALATLPAACDRLGRQGRHP
jgi:hypothetical protein